MTDDRKDVWAAGKLYEPYVGRWSRLIAKELLRWLEGTRRQGLVGRGVRYRRTD